MEEVCAREQAAGRRPYLIPYGGSNPIGAAAYAAAMHELLEQDAGFDRIVFASSSGGTQAGLLLGARQRGFRGLLHGISVDRPAAELAALVTELAGRTAELLGGSERFDPAQVLVDDRFLGGGYGVMGEPEREAIELFARNEAILLDPVYTGRAAAGLLSLARSAELRAGERVLFWHTGGVPALWAYADELA
jgi:1-aminocyclopropane-1-carboxylate deaminase/D-cysteine desulfhydrase-like pyridoxal-dependent ACC family enzyme